jgi:hypothetical protein
MLAYGDWGRIEPVRFRRAVENAVSVGTITPNGEHR